MCKLTKILTAPELYAPSSAPFWDDEHISNRMLEAHLDPNHDAASRRPEFVDRSVNWISEIAPPTKYTSLLDLGCGSIPCQCIGQRPLPVGIWILGDRCPLCT